MIYIGFARDMHYGLRFTLQQIQVLCSELIILIYVLRTKQRMRSCSMI